MHAPRRGRRHARQQAVQPDDRQRRNQMQVMLPAQKRSRRSKADAEQYAHMQPRNSQQVRRPRAPKRLLQFGWDVPPQSQQRGLSKRRLRLRHNGGDGHSKPPPEFIQRAVERAALALSGKRYAARVQHLRNALPRKVSRIVESIQLRRLADSPLDQHPVTITKVRRFPDSRYFNRCARRNKHRPFHSHPLAATRPNALHTQPKARKAPQRLHIAQHNALDLPRARACVRRQGRIFSHRHARNADYECQDNQRSHRGPPQSQQQKCAQQRGSAERQERNSRRRADLKCKNNAAHEHDCGNH